MLRSITLPRIADVGWRLKAAFKQSLIIQLEGNGWFDGPCRAFAVSPSFTLEYLETAAESLWSQWRKAWSDHPRLEKSDGMIFGPLPGWFGYLGYDIETITSPKKPPIEELNRIPSACLGFFPCVIAEFPTHVEMRYLSVYESTAQEVINALKTVPHKTPFQLEKPFQQDSTKAYYTAALHKIAKYIHDGDCYQVNFAHRFSTKGSGEVYSAYERIFQTMESPFSGFVQHPKGCILSFSPEQFLALESGNVSTSPIKGTRPRGNTTQQDQNNKLALQSSAKDQAENLMIVDLLRNDVSKVAELGSVSVPQLFNIETFTHVHHLVSKVQAKLRKDCNAVDLFEACFPGGSITGAPKRRAREIIAELEPYPRSVYCGSLFYSDIYGRLQSNILIRTVLMEGNRLYCWGGGGIVADSDCEEEYQETLHKVGLLMKLFDE